MITEGKKNPYSYEYELEVQKALLAACGVAEYFSN